MVNFSAASARTSSRRTCPDAAPVQAHHHAPSPRKGERPPRPCHLWLPRPSCAHARPHPFLRHALSPSSNCRCEMERREGREGGGRGEERARHTARGRSRSSAAGRCPPTTVPLQHVQHPIYFRKIKMKHLQIHLKTNETLQTCF
jgi:hypothetical protein